MSEALRLADLLETGAIWQDQEAAAAELRRLHAELERKSDAIQRLWKERDELRSECRTLVRQNGEWQELNAELVEALRRAVNAWFRPHGINYVDFKPYMEAARAALAKVEASK